MIIIIEWSMEICSFLWCRLFEFLFLIWQLTLIYVQIVRDQYEVNLILFYLFVKSLNESLVELLSYIEQDHKYIMTSTCLCNVYVSNINYTSPLLVIVILKMYIIVKLFWLQRHWQQHGRYFRKIRDGKSLPCCNWV